MYIYYIQYIMPKYNNNNNRLSKNTPINIKSTRSTSPSNTNQPTNSTFNTIKDAVIYSTVFSGTSRLMDGILGNRQVDVVEKNGKNDYCEKIMEKYKNDKYNEFLKEEY